MTNPALVWSVRRRPGPGLWLVGGLCGLGFLAGSVLLAGLLEMAPWMGWGVGLGLLAYALAYLGMGAEVRITDDGVLTYALRGHDNLACDLAAIRAVRHVQAGALSGTGLDIDPAQIRILWRKGISPRHLAEQHRDQGVIVLEYLTPADSVDLARLWAQHHRVE